MAKADYLTFVKDPDQAARRGELAEFVGPDTPKYLKTYDDLYAVANRAPGEKAKFKFFNFSGGFNVGAFFVGPVWMFYRKMWLWGAGLTVFIIVMGFTPLSNRIGLPLGIALAGFSRQMYIHHAISTIAKLRAAAGGAPLSPQVLAATGGVSKLAGIIGGIVYALLIILAVIGIILSARSGVPLQ